MKEPIHIKACEQDQQLTFSATLAVRNAKVPVNISVNKIASNLIEITLTPCPHAITRHAHSLFPIAELSSASGEKVVGMLVQNKDALRILLSAKLS